MGRRCSWIENAERALHRDVPHAHRHVVARHDVLAVAGEACVRDRRGDLTEERLVRRVVGLLEDLRVLVAERARAHVAEADAPPVDDRVASGTSGVEIGLQRPDRREPRLQRRHHRVERPASSGSSVVSSGATRRRLRLQDLEAPPRPSASRRDRPSAAARVPQIEAEVSGARPTAASARSEANRARHVGELGSGETVSNAVCRSHDSARTTRD